MIGRRCREDPGVVIMLVGVDTWVVMRSELWEVSTKNCTMSVDEEKQGIEAVEPSLPRHEFWELTPEGVALESPEGGGQHSSSNDVRTYRTASALNAALRREVGDIGRSNE